MSEQKQRMIAGELYMADDPELQEDALRAKAVMHELNTLHPAEKARRNALVAELLGEVGEGSTVLPPFHCDYGQYISMGSGCFVNHGAVMLDVARITIGDAVLIGPNVQLLTPTHPLDPAVRREGWEGGAPIDIEDNVWIGGGAIVLPGVRIGENAVVGAGAVVTKDVPRNAVVVGNPARVVRIVEG